MLSGVYSAARNMPKAEEQLELVLKIDPNNATVCNDLGYIWADQNKNLAQAEELIRKAIDLDRQQRKGPPGPGAERVNDNAAYVDSLGWVLYRRGQADAARKELDSKSKSGSKDTPSKVLLDRTAREVDTLRNTLRNWHGFYDGYNPEFTWWTKQTYPKVEKDLQDYADTLRKKLGGEGEDAQKDQGHHPTPLASGRRRSCGAPSGWPGPANWPRRRTARRPGPSRSSSAPRGTPGSRWATG